jgi:hypothetical protein
MSLFKRGQTEDRGMEETHDVRVEVIVNKEKTRDALDEAIDANKRLNEVLRANHFTIKIFRAAGGEIKTQRKHA